MGMGFNVLHASSIPMGNVGGLIDAGRVGGAIYPDGGDPESQLKESTMPWYAKVNAARGTGVLPQKDLNNPGSPMMDDWLDALKLQTGGNAKLTAGPSEPGSNQLRGESVQPSYLGMSGINKPASSGGSSMPAAARRPSMSALGGNGQAAPGEYSQDIPFVDDDPYSGHLAENRLAFERRQRSDMATDARFNDQTSRNMLDDELISGRAMSRQDRLGAVGNRAARYAGEAEAEKYFAPGQEGMRQNVDRRSLDALRSRYLDPAVVKAQADLERQQLANSGRSDVANIEQRGGLMRDAVTGRSRIGAAFATQGDVDNAGNYAPPAAPATNEFPAARLQEFMDTNGIRSEAEARALLAQYGYAVR
jgi:hypothetical protein